MPKDNLEISDIKDITGKCFLIRTATYFDLGKVEKIVSEKFLKLSNASWVADTGRFTNAIKDGHLSEVEPVGDCLVNIDSIIDMFPWVHTLPTKQI